MTNFQRFAIAAIAAIFGAAIQQSLTPPSPARSDDGCLYHVGDLNRAAQAVGERAYAQTHGYGALYDQAGTYQDQPVNQAADQPVSVQSNARTSSDDVASGWGSN